MSAKDMTNIGVKELDNDLGWTVCRYALSSFLHCCSRHKAPSLCSAFSLSDRGPRALVNRRLLKHIAYVSNDDMLLSREGLGVRLAVEEVRMPLTERGQFLTRSASR